MNPLIIVLPVLGIGGYLVYRALQPAQYLPPPGTPAVGSGGVRYQSYLSQINDAMLAFRAAKAFGETSGTAAMTTRGTLDIVASMAGVDLAQGNITQADMNNLNAQIAAGKKEIGA
jgi:hypothetical protein